MSGLLTRTTAALTKAVNTLEEIRSGNTPNPNAFSVLMVDLGLDLYAAQSVLDMAAKRKAEHAANIDDEDSAPDHP